MKFGMSWAGREVAREAEQAGIEAFVTGDFVDHDAYLNLAEMVASTERAMVGPAIAYAFARTPYAHATAMRQLHAQAPGRLFLGLGSAAFRINRDWFGVPADKPMARIAETAQAVRAWLHAENGQKIQYSGKYYEIDADVRAPVLGRLDIPILLAGFNAGMAATAARVGDGIIGHGLFTGSWWNEVVRPATARGAHEGGNDRVPLEHGWIITAVNDAEPERAILDARRMIAFYLTVKTYDPFVEHHGWQGPVERLRTAFRAGDMTAMAEAVTDEMLGEIAICGTTADARAALARRADGLPRDIGYLAPPSYLVSGKRRAAYARASLALIEDHPRS